MFQSFKKSGVWWPGVIICKIYFKCEMQKRKWSFEDVNNVKIKIKLIFIWNVINFYINFKSHLKKIKFIFNSKNKMKIKIFHLAERYHLPSVIVSSMVCIMLKESHIVLLKNSNYFTKRFISTQNIKWKENEWTKFVL